MATLRNRITWYTCGVTLLLLAGGVIYQQVEPPNRNSTSTGSLPARKSSVSQDSRGMATRAGRPQALQKLPELPAPIVSPHSTGSDEDQEWIAKRIDELDALTWFDDFESLGKILTELRNPLPEIRAAALDATRDFGSRDAIPYLEAISSDSKEPLEQKAIQDLIEFLKLPTLLEESSINSDE